MACQRDRLGRIGRRVIPRLLGQDDPAASYGVCTLCTSVCIGGSGMGRANVYLPDDLERRVKAARIPVSEVCQEALLKAVEAAESATPSLDEAITGAYQEGARAGEQWARTASP